MTDAQFLAVKRPFDAARLRMSEAGNADLVRDELSNMLHHLYRLGELRREKWSPSPPTKITEGELNLRAASVPGVLGALWIRCYDTHDIATLADPRDDYSNTYRNSEPLIWRSLTSMSFAKKPTKQVMKVRYKDYKAIQNRAVLDTLPQAFDGLANLP